MKRGSSFSTLWVGRGKKIAAKRAGSTEETHAHNPGGSGCVNTAGHPTLPCVCRDWKEKSVF